MVSVELRLLPGFDFGRHGVESGVLQLGAGEGVTLGAFLERTGVDMHGMLAVLVNGRHAAYDRVLEDGDAVSVFPPTSVREVI